MIRGAFVRIFEQNDYKFGKIKEALFSEKPYPFFTEPKKKVEAKHYFMVEYGRTLKKVTFGELSNTEPEKLEINQFRKECLRDKIEPIPPLQIVFAQEEIKRLLCNEKMDEKRLEKMQATRLE